MWKNIASSPPLLQPLKTERTKPTNDLEEVQPPSNFAAQYSKIKTNLFQGQSRGEKQSDNKNFTVNIIVN